MPTHEQNKHTWNDSYDWSRYQGDEWSARWGGPDMQWYWCIYPRIRRHLPAETILDIGPGFGRWTKYLLDHCQHMVLVDLSEKCIYGCRQRFGEERVSYRVGSGDSLAFLDDQSIDFCFSWEALVYCEFEAVQGYLTDLRKKLKDGGMAFLHHSNIGAYPGYFNLTKHVPKPARDFLKKRGLLDYDQCRGRTVTAENFAALARDLGFEIWSQELIPWGGKRLIDCFTTLGLKASGKDTQVLEYPRFHKDAYEIQRLSWLYGEGVPW